MHLWSPRNILPNFYFKIFCRFFVDSCKFNGKGFLFHLSLSLSLYKFNWPMQFYILDIFTGSVCVCANVTNGKKWFFLCYLLFFYAMVHYQQTTLCIKGKDYVRVALNQSGWCYVSTIGHNTCANIHIFLLFIFIFYFFFMF